MRIKINDLLFLCKRDSFLVQCFFVWFCQVERVEVVRRKSNKILSQSFHFHFRSWTSPSHTWCSSDRRQIRKQKYIFTINRPTTIHFTVIRHYLFYRHTAVIQYPTHHCLLLEFYKNGHWAHNTTIPYDERETLWNVNHADYSRIYTPSENRRGFHSTSDWWTKWTLMQPC